MSNNLFFGADPEYFAYNENVGIISPPLLEKFSGVKRIGGDNKHPFYIETKDYIWMGDGVAHELTLKKPYTSMIEMHEQIRISIEHLQEHLSKFKFEGFDLELLAKPTAPIKNKFYLPYLTDESIYMGFIYGCDPDDDAIDVNYDCKTKDASRDNFRYAGGHFHLSCPDLSKLFYTFPKIAIRLLAVSLGNFVTANSPCPDLELQRVGTYGRPGRFRLQHYKNDTYGVEYRTPSVTWTTFSSDKIEIMEELVRKTVKLYEKGSYGDKRTTYILQELLPETIAAINNVNQEKSKDILEKFNEI